MTQPSDPIVTNKTTAEEKRVTEIRNQVTLLEGESVRLRDLIQAEKYEVNELVKQKAELKDSILKLKADFDVVGEDIASCTNSLEALNEQKKEVEKEVKDFNEILESGTIVYNKMHAEIAESKTYLEIEKAELAKDQESLREQAAVLSEKQNKLRELLS